MRGRVVIGANFGDEGKGLLTDYLCATEGAGMVVRFNGGSQAGHTVVLPDGTRHVFKHMGSGTFCGVPTFLSQFFICNPLMFLKEYEELVKLGVTPMVYAHPNCVVTTFADMVINQRKEDARGDKRHGSVGLGINETINRSQVPELNITMSDLWNSVPLQDKLAQICDRWAAYRTGKPIEKPEAMIAEFIKRCGVFAGLVHPLGIQQCPDPVFEGAQGLILDQGNKAMFPHVTRSNTGLKNVRALAAQAGIDALDVYYVSRTYLTRHGAGPLPGHNPAMSFPDNTNTEHAYQGTLRFAPLDVKELSDRVRADAGSDPFKLALTHCDQLFPAFHADLYADGPTRNHVNPASSTMAATA